VAWQRLGPQGPRPGVRSQLLAYSPAADAWRVLVPAADAPPGAVAWVGGELLTWRACDVRCAGLAIDPGTGATRDIAPAPGSVIFSPLTPSGRTVSVVFLGSLTGFRYDPAADRWDVLPQLEPRRCCPTVAWSGTELLAWGGDLAATVETGARLRLPDGPVAPAPGPPIRVELTAGTLFSWDGGRVWLASGCGDSQPPSCGERGPVEVLGLDLAAAPGAQTVGGLTWTDDAVIRGDFDVTAGTLTVVDVQPRGPDGIPPVGVAPTETCGLDDDELARRLQALDDPASWLLRAYCGVDGAVHLVVVFDDPTTIARATQIGGGVAYVVDALLRRI
jgi:hypothetical protein